MTAPPLPAVLQLRRQRRFYAFVMFFVMLRCGLVIPQHNKCATG